MTIPIYKPYFTEYNLRYAHATLKSGWISHGYAYYDETVEKLKEMFGYKYVLLTSSGTAANHLMTKCIAKKFPTKTVIIPNNVYVAAWNPFLYDRAFHLFYLDANLDTWNIQTNDIIKDGHQYIFLAVHNLGNPIDVPWLKEAYPDLVIVEDNCEGFGGKYRGLNTGTESIYSTLSFYANKTITCGEGGAFITNDESSYEYAKMIHGQGQSHERYIHHHLGYNYRMTSLQAAILFGQLEDYDEIIRQKKYIFNFYKSELSSLVPDKIDFQIQELHCEHSNWMFGIRIFGNPTYKAAQGFFDKSGIETRPMFYPITYHNHLKHINGTSIKNADLLSRECLLLPSYPELNDIQLDYIVKAVKIYANKVGGR